MEFEYKVTVFTPTYNRAYILEKLYHSLQRQSCTAFEWLVVDDGSSDDTGQLFDTWCREENPFPVRYVRQENGGKCRAINHGLKLAKGELFFTVDSDDYLTDDAVEKVIRWEKELPKDGNYCGLAGNLGTSPTETPNRAFEKGYFDGNAFDRYGAVDGERASVFYTQIHRQYLYPEFPGEKFLTEAVAWNRMAGDGYNMRFYNDIIWIYEYRTDGLTKSGYQLFLNNPQGTGLFFREKCVFLNYSFKTKLGLWYGYATDAFDRCTDAQISEYIGCPLWLLKPIRGVHACMQGIHAITNLIKKR